MYLYIVAFIKLNNLHNRKHGCYLAGQSTKVINIISLISWQKDKLLSLLSGDGVINAAGMGFNGYDKNGEQRWDAFTNIKVKNIEVITRISYYNTRMPFLLQFTLITFWFLKSLNNINECVGCF